MAISQGLILSVERRFLMKILPLIMCSMKIMADRRKGCRKEKGGRGVTC